MAGGSNNLDGIVATTEKVGAVSGVNLAKEPEVPEDKIESQPQILLSWNAPSFSHKDKNFIWFLVAGVAILGLIGFFIYTKDWFSIGIVVVVSAVLFWYVAKVRPHDTEYSITDLGINAGNHNYPFSEIHSYWIVYNDHTRTLNIAFLKKYLPTLVIGLGDINPLNIKELLSIHIPEQEKRTETLVDKIIRTIGL